MASIGMPRGRKRGSAALSVRKLKRELESILSDANRQGRFLDLLLSERRSVRTQAERAVVRELIEQTRRALEDQQQKLGRYRACYLRFKEDRFFDRSLLEPDELETLLRSAEPAVLRLSASPRSQQQDRRTGTDG